MRQQRRMFIDPETVAEEVKSMVDTLKAFPEAAAVAVSKGGTTETTQQFRQSVSQAALEMSRSTTRIVAALNGTADTMRKVLAQLVENDESLAEETRAINALLDITTSTNQKK